MMRAPHRTHASDRLSRVSPRPGTFRIWQVNERNLASVGANPLAHMLAMGEWSELHEREFEQHN